MALPMVLTKVLSRAIMGDDILAVRDDVRRCGLRVLRRRVPRRRARIIGTLWYVWRVGIVLGHFKSVRGGVNDNDARKCSENMQSYEIKLTLWLGLFSFGLLEGQDIFYNSTENDTFGREEQTRIRTRPQVYVCLS